ncbi:hypothetical protein ACFWN7_00660 [Agromyces sp. NPDC058484]|uniref:hypothetical protein n=1 Tax=Agromyces sp. NPDC058484 TaxID=3346524 RepID=UPI0036691248
MTSSQEPPLTRRELRERERLREQQAATSTPDAAATTPAPAAPSRQPASTPPAAAVTTPAPANPFAPRSQPEPQAPAPGRYPDAVEPEPPTPERTLTRRELRAILDANSADFFDLESEDESVEPTSRPAAAAAAVPAAPFPSHQAAHVPAPAPTRAPTPHQISESAIADEPVAAPKPVGHWTDQLNAPVDRAEPFDQLLSRGAVSHGVPTTTNALILPTLPDHGPLGDSIASSGEVIITGSVDLPRSYGATGVHPSQIDSSDVDRLFDQVEDGAGIGAPVAATRAISTQGAARAMMAPPKKEGMNVPLVLAVTAGVLALGVVAALVIGAVAGLF